MEKSKIRIFLYVVDSGSLTKAATAFGYTTSGISHMMAALEEEVGFPLLVRSKSGVVPTDNANRLIPIMRSQVSWDEQLQQEVAEISGLNKGTLTIASYYSIASQWLPTVISRFHRDYPNIQINVLEGVWHEVAANLTEHRADMGFYSYMPSIKYHWIPLKSVPMVVIVPANHRLAEKGMVRLEDLEGETIIMPDSGSDADVQTLFANNKKLKYQFSTLHIHTAMAMVEQGVGISITNELVTKGHTSNVKILPLDPPRPCEFGLSFPADTKLTPAAAKFIEYTKTIIRDSSMF